MPVTEGAEVSVAAALGAAVVVVMVATTDTVDATPVTPNPF